MAKSNTEPPNQMVSAKVRAALESTRRENYELVAYLCEMALEELRLLDAEECRKATAEVGG